MVSLDVFQEEFRKLKEVDHRKDQLIERLILQVEEFQINLTEKKLHLEREQTTIKVYQSKHKEVRDELKKLEEDIRSNNFVSVLIDGDCMPFLDALVILAQQGGLEAVRCLRNKVCEYVSKELKLPSNIAVRIRVYANIKGLASAYFFNKVLERQDDLSMFIRGFNMGHPMCDFVDAGDGKECADAKLKAWFDHDVADVQCRAVFLGGSADNGYARLLQPHVGDNLEKDRIVLIEGPPFAKELAVLRDSFIVARFPDVFRTTKLPARRVSFTTTPPRTPVPPTYAATIGRAADAVKIDEANVTSVAADFRKRYTVMQNSRGQRLDSIINPPQSLVKVLRTTKHCNTFHILGCCTFDNCEYLHGVRLDENGIAARRLSLRYTPCPSKLHCKDEKCLLGHQCPDKGCIKGNGCRFKKEMHNVDRS